MNRFISSKYLYPLWRIGLIERAFFLACRMFDFRPRIKRVWENTLFGFDISYYQGVVDFVKMLAYGARFLVLRCGYALTQDTKFALYFEQAKDLFAGKISIYHFYDPVADPVAQANKVLAILAPYRGQIKRVWLDFEFWWSGNYSAVKHWKTYRDIIRAQYPVGIYTRATWWDSRVTMAEALDFATDPLWAAQYNSALTLIPKGWQKAARWQRGTPAIGRVAGVESLEIDENLEDTEFYASEYGGQTPPIGGTMAEYKVTGANGVNLRPSPSTSTTVIKLIAKDSTIWGIPDILGWIKGSAYQEPGGVKTERIFYCVASLVTEISPPPSSSAHTVDVLIDGVNVFHKDLD